MAIYIFKIKLAWPLHYALIIKLAIANKSYQTEISICWMYLSNKLFSILKFLTFSWVNHEDGFWACN